MKRIHLFEFTDQSWYPQTFRRIQTEYLQFVATRGSAHQYLLPLLQKALQHAGAFEIVDLCSGGSGPWLRLYEQFQRAGWPVRILLTDKFPNPAAVQKWASAAQQGITYLSEPVDAMQVPHYLKGMRTLFEGFHHFKPEQARAILRDAAERRVPIAIFEISPKPPFTIPLLLLSPLMTLLSYLLLTPFITPRTVPRFLWTYIIPLVPLATCWDGVISLLRVYTPQELTELSGSILCSDYNWETGLAPTGTPLFDYIYLLGYPNI